MAANRAAAIASGESPGISNRPAAQMQLPLHHASSSCMSGSTWRQSFESCSNRGQARAFQRIGRRESVGSTFDGRRRSAKEIGRVSNAGMTHCASTPAAAPAPQEFASARASWTRARRRPRSAMHRPQRHAIAPPETLSDQRAASPVYHCPGRSAPGPARVLRLHARNSSHRAHACRRLAPRYSTQVVRSSAATKSARRPWSGAVERSRSTSTARRIEHRVPLRGGVRKVTPGFRAGSARSSRARTRPGSSRRAEIGAAEPARASRRADVSFAGEQAGRLIQPDPARARQINLAPGVQVGEVALGALGPSIDLTSAVSWIR